MSAFTSSMAVIVTVLSGTVLYTASPHARGHRRYCRRRLLAGLALAVAAAAAWIARLGAGAGLCAMLTCWMLTMVALPWLALFRRRRTHPAERD